MTIFLESPWPALVGGGLLALVLLAIAIKTGRGLWLIVMGGVLLVTAGLVVLERLVVTERERVEQAIYDTADAVERNNLAEVLDHVSPSAAAARTRIRSELPAFMISNVSLSDMTTELGNPPTTATVDVVGHCWVDERRGGARMTAVQRFLVRLQKENGRWLLVSYEERPLLGK